MRVHDSQAYRQMDMARERISHTSELRAYSAYNYLAVQSSGPNRNFRLQRALRGSSKLASIRRQRSYREQLGSSSTKFTLEPLLSVPCSIGFRKVNQKVKNYLSEHPLKHLDSNAQRIYPFTTSSCTLALLTYLTIHFVICSRNSVL